MSHVYFFKMVKLNSVSYLSILLITISKQTGLLRICFSTNFSLDVIVVWSWSHLVQFSLEKRSAVWKLILHRQLGYMEVLNKSLNEILLILTFVLKDPSLYVVNAKCPPFIGNLNLSKFESKF
jgi:hypothetical protein